MSALLKSITLRLCAAATVVVIGCGAAMAQPFLAPQETPKEILQQAFDSPFGRAILETFTQKMHDGADRTCLGGKSMTIGEFKKQGEAILRTRGLAVIEHYYKTVGTKVRDEVTADVLGAGSQDKFKRLLATPEIVRYREIERPRRHTDALYYVLEVMDRYITIEGLNMKPVSPISTGDQYLLDLSGSEKAQDAMFAFEDANKTAAMGQYVALNQKAQEALVRATSADAVGPRVMLKNADQDLARLCVLRKK